RRTHSRLCSGPRQSVRRERPLLNGDFQVRAEAVPSTAYGTFHEPAAGRALEVSEHNQFHPPSCTSNYLPTPVVTGPTLHARAVLIQLNVTDARTEADVPTGDQNRHYHSA